MISNARMLWTLVLPMFAAACGQAADSGDKPNEDVGEVDEALMPGTVDISGTVPTVWSLGESETAVAKSGAFTYVAYNTEDPLVKVAADGHSYSACQGAIGAGYSLNSGSGWSQVRPALPAGQAATWGDPALAIFGIGASATVFLSTLSITQTNFNAIPKDPNGCVRVSTGQTMATKTKFAATVMRGPLGGALSAVSSPAFSDSVNLDGGSMVAAGGKLYAAYNNGNTILVVSMGTTGPATQVPNPPVSPSFHPLLVKGWVANETAPTLVVPTSSSQIVLTTLQPSTNTWTTPITVASNYDLEPITTMKSTGKTIRARGFDAAATNAIADPQVTVVYNFRDGNFERLQAVRCVLAANPPHCDAPAEWATPASTNTFMPSVSEVMKFDSNGNPVGARVYMSYWSDANRSDGKVRLRFTDLSSPLNPSWGSQAQDPCPDTRSYWGDYDAMYQTGNGANNWPSLNRTFTDSTGATCVSKEFVASPRHVSVATFTPQ